MKPKLYLVPTPIGNLQDITLRAIEMLKAVDLILAEDTRTSKKLLNQYQIATPMQAYHEHNKAQKLPWVLKQLQSHTVALISDAGSPAISDPGYELVTACVETDIEVTALPGPTAIIPALTLSGLPTNAFTFIGFLPKKSSSRRQAMDEYKYLTTTLVIYESPYRLLETLEDIKVILGERQVSISRELSKQHEQTLRFSLTQAIEFVRKNSVAGEIVICVAGRDKNSDRWNEAMIRKALTQEANTGTGLSQAAKKIAKVSGWKKSEIYKLGLRQGEE